MDSSLTISSLLLMGFILIAFFQSTDALRPGGKGKHFVLVHGAGHGAWCWYKVTTLLQASNNKVTTIDLTSNGNSKVVADTVTSLHYYATPRIDVLANNVSDEKVVLVGHSLGGFIISYAMELHPDKIAYAYFLATLMPLNGQTTFTALPPEAFTTPIEEGTFIQNYANGPFAPPTSIEFNLFQVKDFLYNKSPDEDVNLAYVALNPTPYAPQQDILNLTTTNYGSIRRFYFRTTFDNSITPRLQDYIINANPPYKVLMVPNSDHSPFFSKPTTLVNLFLSIPMYEETMTRN